MGERKSKSGGTITKLCSVSALPSKPTVSISKLLGIHLSSRVIRQREEANFEQFKYHISLAGSSQSQH